MVSRELSWVCQVLEHTFLEDNNSTDRNSIRKRTGSCATSFIRLLADKYCQKKYLQKFRSNKFPLVAGKGKELLDNVRLFEAKLIESSFLAKMNRHI